MSVFACARLIRAVPPTRRMLQLPVSRWPSWTASSDVVRYQPSHTRDGARRCSSVPGAVADLADVIITPACAKKLASLKTLPEYAGEPIQLRVEVVPGGCSGFEYQFRVEPTSGTQDDDAIFEQLGARLVTDETSLGLLRGSTIDYEQEMIRSAFAVANNPNSDTACGCGTSFSPKDF